MGDSDIGNTDDDPFETYIGSTDELEDDDSSTSSWSWPTGSFMRRAWAIAGLILATASLFGIVATELVSDAISYGATSADDRSIAPAIQAGFAALAIVSGVLALRSHDDEEPDSWRQAVAAAAIIVGILSMIVNLAAVAALLNAPAL